jgi:hypothetical protein
MSSRSKAFKSAIDKIIGMHSNFPSDSTIWTMMKGPYRIWVELATIDRINGNTNLTDCLKWLPRPLWCLWKIIKKPVRILEKNRIFFKSPYLWIYPVHMVIIPVWCIIIKLLSNNLLEVGIKYRGLLRLSF